MAEQQVNHFSKTAKHSAIYAVGMMLRRITGLVMLPIYTRYLTPEDYGTVELLTMAIEIAGILVGLRISQALFRFYILEEDEHQKRVIVSTVLLTIVASSGIGAGLLYLGAEPLTKIIFGTDAYIFEFQLISITLVANAIAAVGLSYLRARQMPILFVSIGMATLALQVALNILFVVIWDMHVTGVVYSSVISGCIVALGLSAYVLYHAGFHYSVDLARRLVAYVMPLILASIAAFYVAYADKYFLRLFSNLTEVGLYALAARIGSVLVTAFEAFNMSWGADRFEIVKKDNARQVYEQVFRFINAALMLVAVGLALFANDFFWLMTSSEFYPSGNIVPILVFAYLISIYTMYCNFGALYVGKTGVMAQASWLKAIFATVGYLLLIPHLGMYGAASVLLFSNFVEFIWVYKRSSRLYDMGLNWPPVIVMLLVAIACVTAGMLLPTTDILSLFFRLALYASLPVLLYILPLWSPGERSSMRLGIKKILRIDRPV